MDVKFGGASASSPIPALAARLPAPRPHPSRKAAADWLPFVRGAWRGLRAKVSQCTVRLDGGKVCEQSRRLLDAKYNIDA